jgi:hypothetical protein
MSERQAGDVCAIGGADDGTLRVCCSTHLLVLCAHHYARSHFVEMMRSFAPEHACDYNRPPMPVASALAKSAVDRNESAGSA